MRWKTTASAAVITITASLWGVGCTPDDGNWANKPVATDTIGSWLNDQSPPPVGTMHDLTLEASGQYVRGDVGEVILRGCRVNEQVSLYGSLALGGRWVNVETAYCRRDRATGIGWARFDFPLYEGMPDTAYLVAGGLWGGNWHLTADSLELNIVDEESCDGVDNDEDGQTDEEMTDGDADGICDEVDVCPAGANTDGDGDGMPDGCDLCPLDADNDEDEDGVCGDVDTCPGFDDSADADEDGTPDGCDEPPDDTDTTPADDTAAPSDDDTAPADDTDTAPADDTDTAPADDTDTTPVDDLCEGLDNDGDGVCNNGDLCVGDDAFGDNNGDGVCNGHMWCRFGGDPGTLIDDTDGDGFDGNCDNCPAVANPTQADTDGDGTGDECEGAEDTAAPVDTAPCGGFDTDSDGTGDECDICPLDPRDDRDADGVCGDADNCDNLANPDQLDSDADGTGDACDDCEGDDRVGDFDIDDVCDDVDPCMGFPNVDTDLDGECDNADGDDDGDGVFDEQDLCPDADDTLDSDADGIPDCDDTEECNDDVDNDGDGTADEGCVTLGCWAPARQYPETDFLDVVSCPNSWSPPAWTTEWMQGTPVLFEELTADQTCGMGEALASVQCCMARTNNFVNDRQCLPPWAQQYLPAAPAQ